MAASSLQTNKILVKGIPRSLHPDKLTIYFQKRKFGGGDVSSVTFPATSKDSDSAIVAFEDPQTVVSVLSRQHKIAGVPVAVQALNPQPEIFSEVTVQLSEFTINCITSKSNLDEVLEKVCDSTGCEYESEPKILLSDKINSSTSKSNLDDVVKKGGDFAGIKSEKQAKISLTGKWYQIQAAFERFENIISAEYEKPSTQAKDEKPSSQTTLMTSYSAGAQSKPSTYREEIRVPISEEIVSTVLDKDIFAYMELVHKTDLDHIMSRFHVSYKTSAINDAMKVELVRMAPDSDPDNAIKMLDELSARLNREVAQDAVEIEKDFPNGEIDRIFSMLRPEFPMVHIDRTDTSPNHIMFIAPNVARCNMAIEMFKHFCGNKAYSKKPGTGGNQKSSLDYTVDKDVFDFIKLTKSAYLDNLWNSNRVQVLERTVDDAVYLTFKAKEGCYNATVEKALGDFRSFYNTVNDSISQDVIPLNSFKPMPTQAIVAQTIHKVDAQYPTVKVSPMSTNDDHIIFTASSEMDCKSAMASFKVIMNSLL